MDLAFNGGSFDTIPYFSFILALQICKEGLQVLRLFITKDKLKTFLCSQNDPQTLTGTACLVQHLYF